MKAEADVFLSGREGNATYHFWLRPGKAGPRCATSLLAVTLLVATLAGLCATTWAQNADPQQLFQNAVAAERRGDEALAAKRFEELVRLRPDMIAAHASLAGVLTTLGRFDEAVAQYRAALQEAPGNRDLSLALGLTYLKKGDVDQAAGLLTSLNKSRPDDVRVAALLGECDLRLGRTAQSIALLAPLEKTNPGNLYLKWVLGSAMIRAGQIYEGVDRVEMVARQTHSPRMYMAAAEANLQIRRFGQAHEDVDAARRLNPQLAGLDTLDGAIMESEGNLNGAIATFQKVLEVNPNDLQAQLHLGTIFYTERRLDAAKLHLQKALEINPASTPARYQLARVERAQGQTDAAVKDFEQAERSDPDWLPPHLELSALYYHLNRREDGARERKIVDRLRAEQLEHGAKPDNLNREVPSP